jgi:hypothetical protein
MNIFRFVVTLLSFVLSAVGASPVVPQTFPLRPPPANARYYPQLFVNESPISAYPQHTEIDPGQLVYLHAPLVSNVSGTSFDLEKCTILSMTGGIIEQNTLYESILISPGVYETSYINKLPYTYAGKPSFWQLALRANPLNSKGRGTPVHVKARYDGDIVRSIFGSPDYHRSPISVVFEFVVPVSDSPALVVSATFNSLNPGELRREGAATVNYRATAAGSNIENLLFRARIPKGTDLVPGQIFPNTGVVSGSEIIWNTAGPVTAFNASIGLRVKKRPGVRIAIASYSAAGLANGYLRSASGKLKMPIKGFDKGSIEYTAPGGINGPVIVGETYPFTCCGWDKEGGSIFVTLNDTAVTTVPFNNPTGQFTVPPFRDPDLRHTLSAEQTGPISDTEVRGEEIASVALAAGMVKVTDGTTTYRALRSGDLIAAGEFPSESNVVGPGNLFGLVKIDGPNSAAHIRYKSGFSVLYARDGGVAVFSKIQVGRLRVSTGRRTITTPATRLPAGVFAEYNPAGRPNTTVITAATFNPTIEAPLEIFGAAYRSGALSVNGPVNFANGFLYVDGDLTIVGDITGAGTIICNGNFTHRGSIELVASDGLLGVTGTFTTEP